MSLNRSRQAKSKKGPKHDFWDWWLSDEPPSLTAQQEIRARKVEQANRYQPRGFAPAAPATAMNPVIPEIKSVVINLSLPKLSDFKLKKLYSMARRRPRLAASVVILALIAIIVALPAKPAKKTPLETSAAGTSAPTALKQSTKAIANAAQPAQSTASTGSSASSSVLSANTGPSFMPIAPIDEPELAKSQFGRTAYDANRGVYTIMDSFMGAPLTINEEAVPKNYTSDDQAANAEAAKIGAGQSVTYLTGTAYMQAAGSGAQTVVLAKRGVLVYINSLASHSASDWQNYLNKLY